VRTKLFIFSKTIIGILIAAVAYFFGDKVGMPDDVKSWLIAFGLGLAGYGRFVADSKLVFGVGGGEKGSVSPSTRNRRTPKL